MVEAGGWDAGRGDDPSGLVVCAPPVGEAAPFSVAELAGWLSGPEFVSVPIPLQDVPFAPQLPEDACADAAEDAAERALMCVDALRLRQCRDAAAMARALAAFAAARAQLHDAVDVAGRGRGQLHAGRPVQVGGAGTPLVDEFCCAELGPVLGVSSVSARNRLADALDLVHRHPATLEALDRGELDGFRAALLVRGTRRLDQDKAAQVEDELLPRAGRLPIRRLVEQVKAAVIAADPALAESERDQQHRGRRIGFGPAEDGVREVWGVLDAAGATRLDQRIDQVARLARPGRRRRPPRRTPRCADGRADRRAAGRTVGWAVS